MDDYKRKYEEAFGRARTFSQRWQGIEATDSELALQELKEIFPELKESEDERIRKSIIDLVEKQMPKSENKKWMIAWLEKQGEQNLTRPIWKYKKDHTPLLRDSVILNKYGCVAKSPSGALVSDVWVLDFDELAKLPKEEFEKQGEQKPADKVELKFKIGDWIVSNRTNKTYKIDSIDTKDANYIIYSCVPSVYTNEDSPCFSESMIHLWTIQDAKDGDVLAFDSEYKGNRMVQVGIIKKYVGKHGGCSNTFNIYVGVNWDNNLQIDEYMGCSDIRPATKEQRELLFQKMHEAGYVWDVEKKELKKIEQKPAWSEEDVNLLNRLIGVLDGTNKEDYHEAWEETFLPWLKSLKERYTWKPSDEQMEALLKLEEMHVLEHEKNQENAHLYMVIKSLKEQLLKLKGE